MEDIPPSYQQSTNPSVLDLIAPYLDTLSLHALTLVSRSYNEAFMPHLWGSPASHFVPLAGPALPGVSSNVQQGGSYDDMVYVALTRFKRVLKRARIITRCLVHTLYLPPAVSEIYGGPNATWLREILDWLPNLQSLCVGGLPFFDHHSLVAVDKKKGLTLDDGYQLYPLKLLLASKEPNATSIGLSLFIPHVSNLVYLDFSYTTPARDINVLSSLYALTDLRVLKLRGVGLRDTEMDVLARAIGLRVRLLDVSENLFGDGAVRSLIQHCSYHSIDQNTMPGRNGTSQSVNHNSRRQLDSWPVGLPPAPDFLSLDTLRSSDLDKNLLTQLTNPLTGRLAFEDIPDSGLTHLYVTSNPAVTIEGIGAILALGKLHVLDAGDVAGETAVDKYVKLNISMGRIQRRPRSATNGSQSISSGLSGDLVDIDDDLMKFPGAEKLVPVLREKAGKNLTYLRIDHAVITKQIEVTTKEVQAVEVPGSMPRIVAELSARPGDGQLVEIPGSNYHATELADTPIFELDGMPTFRAELPGDPIHFALSPPVGEAPIVEADEVDIPKHIRGEGAYAPEVVGLDEMNGNGDKIVADATAFGKRENECETLSTLHTSTKLMTETRGIDNTINTERKPSLFSIRQTRAETLIKSRPKEPSPCLHPYSLRNLRTFVLTNIPSQVLASSSLIKALRTFITACAAEAHLALLQAKTNYSLPPGRTRALAEREHALTLFALRTIVLEVVPVSQDSPSQRDWRHTRRFLDVSKSSTGDRDSEALWSAAENDFSFFGEEGEEHDECGIYDHEPGKYFPSAVVDEKFAVGADDLLSPSSGTFKRSGSFGMTNQLGSSPSRVFQSPRELPLGRNRRSSGEAHRGSPPTSDFMPITSSTRNSSTAEMPGSIPPPSSPRRSIPAPTSAPKQQQEKQPEQPPPMIDVITELSKFRKDRKALYEEAIRRHKFEYPSRQNQSSSSSIDSDVFVEGHWAGEIKVVRTNNFGGSGGVGGKSGGGGGGMGGRNRGSSTINGKLERTGMVDLYGNYFEKGYLYS